MCSRHAHATTEYGKFIVGSRPMRMREYTAMNNNKKYFHMISSDLLFCFEYLKKYFIVLPYIPPNYILRDFLGFNCPFVKLPKTLFTTKRSQNVLYNKQSQTALQIFFTRRFLSQLFFVAYSLQ